MENDNDKHYIHHLQKRLKVLITHDPTLSTFGSATDNGSGHGFKLRPTLSEEALQQFERKFDIALPKVYRAFLKHMGNGGAGPGYGMFPLSVPKDTGDLGDRYLATEFPITQPIHDDDDDIDGDSPLAEYGYGHFSGCLSLSHNGCGIMDFLIVTGPCRGQVWTDDRCSDNGVYPNASSFAAWYSEWLNEAFLKLYTAKLSRNQYVDFHVTSPQRFEQLLAFFRRLRTDQRGDGISSNESVYLEYFDEDARRHFWFPTEAERRDWERRWNATPPEKRWNNPDLQHPREFDSVIRGTKNSKIEYLRCDMVDDATARFEYEDAGEYVNRADINVIEIVEAFGFTITETGDGRGPRPEPLWNYSGM